MDAQYKRTLAGSVGAGMGAIFNASGRTYYILEHKTETKYHHAGESQKIIVDQIELGRDSSCQVRFDEACETVSRKHAAIVRDGESWKLIPLSQTNATFVNGQRVEGEYHLKSGDEIKLSSRGPVLGFIVPQGEKSLVKSIGMTERMNLFRKQALRPYKTALTILSVALVLAVAGLVTYNIVQGKKYTAEIEGLHAQQQEAVEQITVLSEENNAAKVALEELSVKAESAEEERINAQAALDSLKNVTNATKEELAQATTRARNAEYAASQARKAAKEAASTADAAQEKLTEMEAKKEEIEAKIAEAEQKNGDSEIVTPSAFANIEDCYEAVYYIKMNDIVIYDETNKEIARFNTENKIGGTGFLLEDGRFVTAHRVVEPWFYREYDAVIGKDFDNHTWTYREVQACAINGLKVVANCTAYSPSGANFQFKNTDMRMYPLVNKSDNELLGMVDFIEDYKYPKFIRSLIKVKDLKKLRLYTDLIHQHDWASMAKRDQLTTVKGLKFSNDISAKPKSKTEVNILGYPKRIGYSDSQNVNPTNNANMINVSGLNDRNVIELSSRRYQEGNDGAPVLQLYDGQWTVIGILSHTDAADRDVVTPIINTRR